MTCNVGEQREAKKRGVSGRGMQTAQLGVEDKYVRMQHEKKTKRKNEDGKQEVEERRKSGWVTMNEIKITMERCKERFPSPPPLLPCCFH